MKLPMANATLTTVTGAGASEDYDEAATAGAEKWAGHAGVYFTEQTERVQNGQVSNVIVGRYVVAPAELPVEFEQGDTLTFTSRGATVTEDVVRVQRTEFPGAPGIVRLILRDG